MPLDAAERMRRYREKLKANPEKYEEHKRKHAKLVKERSKKIAELTDKEKEKLRKKWREQKQKQKKKKASECNPAESSKNTYKIKKGKIKARNRSRISRQYKAALKKIDTLTKALQTTRKQFYRYKVKSSKEIELLQQCVTKMKIRGEVLESSLKSTYEKCRTHEQKRLFKSLADNEKVTAAKMKTKFSKLLGLKGKIRKSKERVKNVKTRLEMEKFFTRDDVSRITAGKKECRTSKKKKEQIRYLIDTMYILYQKYKSEGGKYSFSTFYKYKPFFVLSPNVKNRDTCLCIKHSNIELQLCALQKVLITNHRSITDVLKQLCCDLNSYPCMYGTCQTCKKNKLDYQLKEGQINLNVEWFHWERIDHTYEKNENGTIKTVTTKKAAKVKKTGTIDTLIKNFENDIPAFKIHYFTWIHQQRQYQKCINELQENEALILWDFSENYLCKMANEIQSMHFGAAKAQITLHTGMIYWKDACQSFCTVADSNCHEPQAIWAHLLPIIKLTRETKPTTIIHFYSDGPSSQYRQKKNFFLHNHFTCELGLDYSTWSFSESGHGKGVADGIGGAVKRALDRQVAYGKDISDAREAYDVLKNCMKTVECLLIKNADIDIITKILPKNLKAVPGTMKIHQISSRFRDIIIYRTHTCFCSSERGMGDCYSPQKYVFGQPNRDERRSEIRDGIKKVARDKKENKTIDERNGIKKVARDKKENKTRYERDCIKKLVRDKKRNKTKDERDHGNEKFNERGDGKINDRRDNEKNAISDKDGDKIRNERGYETINDNVVDIEPIEQKDNGENKIRDEKGHDIKDEEVIVIEHIQQVEINKCDDVDPIAEQKKPTEETISEYFIQLDNNLNSTAIVSPVIFSLDNDIYIEKDNLDCLSEIKTDKCEQKVTKNKSTDAALQSYSVQLQTTNLKRKSSVANQIDTDEKIRNERGYETINDDVLDIEPIEQKDKGGNKRRDEKGHDIIQHIEINKCGEVDPIAEQKKLTEETISEYVIHWDKNLNSTAIVSPVIFSLDNDIYIEKDNLDCLSEIKTDKCEQKVTKNKSTDAALQNYSVQLQTTNLKRKGSVANQIDTDKKRLCILDTKIYNPKKRVTSSVSRNKENKSLKTIVKRKVICNTCKAELPFHTCTVKCMVCKHFICLACSQGQQLFDYICDNCLNPPDP